MPESHTVPALSRLCPNENKGKQQWFAMAIIIYHNTELNFESENVRLLNQKSTLFGKNSLI